jgi:hypothetical protein
VAAELAQIRLRSSQLPAERGKEQVSGQLAGVQVRDSSWAAKGQEISGPARRSLYNSRRVGLCHDSAKTKDAHLSKSHTTIGTVLAMKERCEHDR